MLQILAFKGKRLAELVKCMAQVRRAYRFLDAKPEGTT
jgi:hypothetical protein